jgi:hypothetical protein
LPYFPPLVVADQVISFDHLQPIRLIVPTQAKPDGVQIDVVFSNHCFSESFNPALHTGVQTDVWDDQIRRVFDQRRYDLSRELPGIVRGLPASAVFMTPESNYVHIVVPAATGVDYRMFFRLKRNRSFGADLKLRVESAYSPQPGQALAPAYMSKIRFKLLVDKTLRGEPVRFHHKR